jgi:hypothetical protein
MLYNYNQLEDQAMEMLNKLEVGCKSWSAFREELLVALHVNKPKTLSAQISQKIYIKQIQTEIAEEL